MKSSAQCTLEPLDMFRAQGLADKIRTWWQETHSPQLELCRHFFGQFFESEFVASPGQLKVLLAGVVSVVGSLALIFLQAYYHKYLLLKQLDDVQPFRLAMLADVLFFVSLTMVLIGLRRYSARSSPPCSCSCCS
jgi:hypothetical protein